MNVGDKWNGWTVESFIGEGTYGKVYKIVRTEFSKSFESALKVISIPQNEAEIATFRNEGMDDNSITTYYKSMVEDIVSEFVIMSELKGNSNIVSYEDHYYEKRADSFGWDIYIRMEMLTPLFKYMKENTFSIRDAIQLGIDICKALEVCQKFNIIHRDIKPENIFVSKFGDFKLGDFGVAKQMENATASMSKRGTYSYMAPEVYKGEPYNSTVDTYSLGVVLYRLLNQNRLPFLPPYPQEIRYSDREKANVRRLSGATMPAPHFAEGRLGEIILKACSYDPKDRYDSPKAMREALESIAYSEAEGKIIYPNGDIVDSDNSGSDSFSQGDPSATDEKRSDNNEEPTDPWVDDDSEDSTEPWTTDENEEPTDPWKDGSEAKEDSHEPEPISEPPEPDPEPETDPPKSFPWKRALPVIAVAFLLVFGGIAIYKYYHHPVPDVVGMDVVDAKVSISKAGLTCTENREFSETIDRNIVIAQTNQGDSVKKQTSITLTVSAGTPVVVPDLKGKTEKEAAKAAKKLGLTVSVGGEELSEDTQKGGVTNQTPEPGSECEVETEIVVTISKGIIQVEVPNVVGKSSEDAEKALKKVGLVSAIETAYSTEPAGTIIAQSVEAGSTIDKHSTVTITSSVGPAPQKSSTGGSGSSKKKSTTKKKSNKSTKSEAEWS